MSRVELIGLKLPIVKVGDSIPGLIVDYCNMNNIELKEKDIIALTSKILSKSLGLLYDLRRIKPSRRALRLATRAGGDPRFIEILLRESDDIIAALPLRDLVVKGIVKPRLLSRNTDNLYRILDMYPTLFITRRDGMIWTDSGLDSSNHPPGIVSVPPRGLDVHARRISDEIKGLTGVRVAVVICDTEVLGFGTMDIARGSYGVPVSARRFGEPDSYGKPKYGGADSVADAVCASAGLIMGQHGEGIPAVLVRGLDYEWDERGVRWAIESIDVRRAIWETVKHTGRVLGFSHIFSKLFVK